MFDIHCHIIFGVDDGSSSLDESLSMLRAARQQGIDRIMCTPHCRWDDWDPALIQQNFETLAAHAEKMGIAMDLGSEVNWKKLAELGIQVAPTLTLGDTDLFLLEFSDASMPPNWQRLVYKLQSMGLTVIVAHPERYKAIQDNLDIAVELKDMGCYLQLSANFIEDGMFGKRKKTATALLRENMVDYVASDAHCPDDYKTYAKAMAFCRNY